MTDNRGYPRYTLPKQYRKNRHRKPISQSDTELQLDDIFYAHPNKTRQKGRPVHISFYVSKGEAAVLDTIIEEHCLDSRSAAMRWLVVQEMSRMGLPVEVNPLRRHKTKRVTF